MIYGYRYASYSIWDFGLSLLPFLIIIIFLYYICLEYVYMAGLLKHSPSMTSGYIKVVPLPLKGLAAYSLSFVYLCIPLLVPIECSMELFKTLYLGLYKVVEITLFSWREKSLFVFLLADLQCLGPLALFWWLVWLSMKLLWSISVLFG